jgi:hypothetical protein
MDMDDVSRVVPCDDYATFVTKRGDVLLVDLLQVGASSAVIKSLSGAILHDGARVQAGATFVNKHTQLTIALLTVSDSASITIQSRDAQLLKLCGPDLPEYHIFEAAHGLRDRKCIVLSGPGTAGTFTVAQTFVNVDVGRIVADLSLSDSRFPGCFTVGDQRFWFGHLSPSRNVQFHTKLFDRVADVVRESDKRIVVRLPNLLDHPGDTIMAVNQVGCDYLLNFGSDKATSVMATRLYRRLVMPNAASVSQQPKSILSAWVRLFGNPDYKIQTVGVGALVRSGRGYMTPMSCLPLGAKRRHREDMVYQHKVHSGSDVRGIVVGIVDPGGDATKDPLLMPLLGFGLLVGAHQEDQSQGKNNYVRVDLLATVAITETTRVITGSMKLTDEDCDMCLTSK